MLPRRNTDDLTLSGSIREARLPSKDLRAEGKASDGALELIPDAKMSASVSARGPKRLPAAAIMHKKLHTCANRLDELPARSG